MAESRVAIPGSDKRPVAQAEHVGDIHPDERIEVTVHLRARDEQELEQRANQIASIAPEAREHLDRETFAQRRSFTPAQIGKLYGFRTDVKGQGRTVAIIELGGGYRKTELTTYFRSLGITPPTVASVSVDHGRNTPAGANSADGEVMLDIE